MCQGIIYRATNLINGKIYIGQTTNKLTRRKREHIYGGSYFHNALNKYGQQNFKWEVIYECDEVMLDMMETFKIMVNNSHYSEGKGYNLNWGGGSNRGYKHTEEAKKKIGEGNKGRIVNEETRKKLSEAGKGHIVTEETRKKLSISLGVPRHPLSEKTKKRIGDGNKGKKMGEEARKKLSDAHKGKKLTEEHKRKISESGKGKKHFVTDEHKMNISKSLKGKKQSPETIAKRVVKLKGQRRKGKNI